MKAIRTQKLLIKMKLSAQFLFVLSSFLTCASGPGQLIWPGDTDASFQPGSRFPIEGEAYTVARLGHNQLIVGGCLEFYVEPNVGSGLAMLTTNGVPLKAPFFEISDYYGSSKGGCVFATAVQPDGKVVIAGTFVRVNGVARTNIARLNPDGTVDSAFAPVITYADPVLGPSAAVFSVTILEDGKILVGGGFDRVNGIVRNNLARLNP
ncbi:MAG: delta-60 repeat domain-containing protein, partial [Verrucomicrobiae bacterium]|nr:delta-60 repeat domain-containing protein [Verrucomicrobiae bacterium]